MDAQVGRGIAAVGIVLAPLGIWLDARAGESYWNLDGTVGAFLLIMAVLGALALLVGWSGSAAGAERALLIIGAILVGFYGFFPAAYAIDDWHLLDAGAWLGLAGAALMTIGALAVLMSWRAAPAVSSVGYPPLGVLLAVLGLVLAFVAIRRKVETDGGSYWHVPDLGQSLGIVMLIALILAGVGIAGTVLGRMPAAAALAAVAGLIACGLFIVIPVRDAVGDLGQLRLGGWLGFFGGLLLAAGTVLLSGAAMRLRPSRTTTTAPPAASTPAATT